jgi:hypothetical protein
MPSRATAALLRAREAAADSAGAAHDLPPPVAHRRRAPGDQAVLPLPRAQHHLLVGRPLPGAAPAGVLPVLLGVTDAQHLRPDPAGQLVAAVPGGPGQLVVAEQDAPVQVLHHRQQRHGLQHLLHHPLPLVHRPLGLELAADVDKAHQAALAAAIGDRLARALERDLDTVRPDHAEPLRDPLATAGEPGQAIAVGRPQPQADVDPDQPVTRAVDKLAKRPVCVHHDAVVVKQQRLGAPVREQAKPLRVVLRRDAVDRCPRPVHAPG